MSLPARECKCCPQTATIPSTITEREFFQNECPIRLDTGHLSRMKTM